MGRQECTFRYWTGVRGDGFLNINVDMVMGILTSRVFSAKLNKDFLAKLADPRAST